MIPSALKVAAQHSIIKSVFHLHQMIPSALSCPVYKADEGSNGAAGCWSSPPSQLCQSTVCFALSHTPFPTTSHIATSWSPPSVTRFSLTWRYDTQLGRTSNECSSLYYGHNMHIIMHQRYLICLEESVAQHIVLSCQQSDNNTYLPIALAQSLPKLAQSSLLFTLVSHPVFFPSIST